MSRKYNFSSGPSALPEPVLRRAQEAIWDLDGSGIGILEHSHRGPEFMAVLDRAERRIREVGRIPDEFAVLFLQGGATQQFFQVPMNFSGPDATVDVCNTGTWSQKALAEAKRYGHVHVAASSEADRFTHLPGAPTWSPSPAYVHVTSNETIHGVQWPALPTPPAGVPLVVDASSDIFSRALDLEHVGLLYAGAQKNVGASGITLVIARRDFLERGRRDLPAMLQYRTWVAERSMINTPPTFGIWLVAEVAAWILAEGGVDAMAARAHARASLLYGFLDQSRLFTPVAHADSRSQMNVTFRLARPAGEPATAALENEIEHAAEARGLSGLRGHRSVGGFRASMYNAFPQAGVEALVALLDELDRRHR